MTLKEALLGLALMYTSCCMPPHNEQGAAQQSSAPSIEESAQDERVTQVTVDNFDRVVLQSSRPVVVEFYADWCGYCQAMEAPYSRAADAMSSRLTFTKYDLDSGRTIPRRYHVDGVPTFVVFDSGREICRVVGARENIQRDLERCLE